MTEGGAVPPVTARVGRYTESWYAARDFKALVGRTITAVRVGGDDDEIEFDTDSGTYKYAAEGDCCSSSWFEHISDTNQIIGSPDTEVRDFEDGSEDDTLHDRTCEARDKPRPSREERYTEGQRCWCDSIKKYAYRIQTAKGGLDIEMRNSSNGYYGGSVELLAAPRLSE